MKNGRMKQDDGRIALDDGRMKQDDGRMKPVDGRMKPVDGRMKQQVSAQKLTEKRIESKIKLKKAFEDIYSRYSKHFPEADEIDLVQEKVVVDNGFVRNTPVKEIGKCVKNFHITRYNPYKKLHYDKKLQYDDDAFDSLLGNEKVKDCRKVGITRVLSGIIQSPVKQNFIHLGDLELQTHLDPLTTPVKKLQSCKLKPVKKLQKCIQKRTSRKFIHKESPLKYEITSSVSVFTEDLENMTVHAVKEDISVQEQELKVDQDKQDSFIDANISSLEEKSEIPIVEEMQVLIEEKSEIPIVEEMQEVALISGVKEQMTDKEEWVEESCQLPSETGSWWDIYEESNSPEYQSRVVVYDSEVDGFEMSEPKRRKHSSHQTRGTASAQSSGPMPSKKSKDEPKLVKKEKEIANKSQPIEPTPKELKEPEAATEKQLSKALKEEVQGNSTFRIVLNDESDEMMILLTGLKNLFQKQLPKMPKEYIARLVYDRNHVSVAVVRAPFIVLGGITYRPFVQRNFAEIVFCAIASTEQVQGYGSRLMCHVKEYVKKSHGVQNFLTYADNYAIGYFKKQGFTTDITLEKSLWVGYIKDYEGGTLMQCTMVPKVNYLDIRGIIAAQKMALFEKIREYTSSHKVYDGINFKNKTKPIDPATVPGIQDAGWNPKLGEATLSPQKSRGPLYHLMRKVLTEMQEHQSSWPFLQPVSGVPDYYNVIKEPMDMKTLDENLEDSKYTTLEAFQKDVQLIFSNCKSYNEDGTTYVKCANRVEKWFKDRFRQLKAEQRIP